MELDGPTIRSLLRELADRLPADGPQHVVVLAGGSLLAWHGLRESTRDVDSLRVMDEELPRAADEVGVEHDLAVEWLARLFLRHSPTAMMRSIVSGSTAVHEIVLARQLSSSY